MIDEIQELMDEYIGWIRGKSTLRQVDNDWIEISTPYLDRHNDYLQLYVKKLGDGNYLLTDDGYILEDLKLSGCPLESPKRIGLLQTTLNGFGATLNEGTLEVRASRNTFAMRKHKLIQAMLAVNDLFYLASPTIASIFKEDVIGWLDENRIKYTLNAKFTGKSGYDHRFDFVIPRSRVEPERILQAINRPNRNTASLLNYSLLDTIGVRAPDSKVYAIINDVGIIPPAVTDALGNYDIRTIPWSQRQNSLEALTA
ncbi:MAG: DUF1828 domain-containing protein [Methanothrix sp.]|nr:DUF1828 domain-containing protein [Methanothrix sp.]